MFTVLAFATFIIFIPHTMLWHATSWSKMIYLNFKAWRPNTEETPRFARKVDGVEESFTKVGWEIKSIEYTESNREGEVKPQFTLTISDQWETYKVTFPFSSVSLSLLNSLCWAADLYSVEISAYKKDGRARLSARSNNELLSWNRDIDAIKAMQNKVKVNGKEVTDNTELYAFAIETMIPTANEIANKEPSF